MSRSRMPIWVLVGATVMLLAYLAAPLSAGATSSDAATTKTYVVVLKNGAVSTGLKAIGRAGGKVLKSDKLGIATVSSANPTFLDDLRSSGAVDGAANNAAFYLGSKDAIATVYVPADTQAAACASFYGVPANIGPEPLSACEWDDRIINASSDGSYAVNRGAGATIGIMDTGIDLTHPDIVPNLDVDLSCSFITSDDPVADPAEKANGDCTNKAAVQDLNGHGTHTASEAASPINGIGTAGVAPEATIVALKAGNIEGYFFTQGVVDAMIYAGDVGLDVVNMSFFADPFLFNCKNEADQRAIVMAIGRASRYAQQHGVVMVAAQGNEAIDLAHPTTDEISPDYPPGAAEIRDVGNYCVVVPNELPGVVGVTGIGPSRVLSFFSSYGAGVTDVTAPSGSSGQAPNPFGRVLAAWSSTAPSIGLPGRDVQAADGSVYAWVQGTSMSSPHAAGVAALIRAAHPDMPAGAVQALLQRSAMPMECPTPDEMDPFSGLIAEQTCVGGPGYTNFYGKGLVDALAAGAA
ncbi:MAG TPA: S8 family serine peptidase [Actinomycetota bacterium]